MLLGENLLVTPSLHLMASQKSQNNSTVINQAASKIKCSLRKSFEPIITKVSSFGNNEKIDGKCGKKLSLVCNGHYDLLSQEMNPYNLNQNGDKGVGILQYFHGKNVFITGATGLVGKAFVEKLLRSTSIGKIYMLIKAEDKEAADDRLTKEIIDSDLFTCLREIRENDYEEFIRDKLIPIPGNICEPNLGMDIKYSQEIMKDVDIIVNCAANTNLNDRYDSLINLNVNSTQRMIRFAKKCVNLKLLVHMSTAYVCGKKEGLISEKPLNMDQNSFPRLDLADEISVAMKSFRNSSSSDYDNISNHMKQLGQERAELFGYYNAYQLTKALSEMVIDEMRGDMPVLIIRPSIIESTYMDPIPGWIQGHRCIDPLITAYGKGQLPAYLADPQQKLDIIPLDYVVNSTIASIAKHGMEYELRKINVYHVGSGVANPIRFEEFFYILHEYFNTSKPLKSEETLEKVKFFDDFGDFSQYTRYEIRRRDASKDGVEMDELSSKKINKQIRSKIVYAEQLCKLYAFIGFMKGRFDTGNMERLLQEMSEEEKLQFEIDTTKIDWRKYFMEIHIPGLERHLFIYIWR